MRHPGANGVASIGPEVKKLSAEDITPLEKRDSSWMRLDDRGRQIDPK
jgi:hypothetical protein